MKYLSALLFGLALVSVTACSEDDDTVQPQPQEFIATDADFTGYQSWARPVQPISGKDPAGLISDAHSADDTNMTRHVFINDNNVTRDGNGNFRIGTRLVKEVRMADGSVAMVTAMVKRGGDFEGVTSKIDGYLMHDGEQLSAGSELYFEVDLRTLDTGIGLRNRHMREGYLHTDKYPFAKYSGNMTKSWKSAKGTEVMVSGSIDIHGKKKSLDVCGVITPAPNGFRIRTAFDTGTVSVIADEGGVDAVPPDRARDHSRNTS
jgi:hypothetical protein